MVFSEDMVRTRFFLLGVVYLIVTTSLYLFFNQSFFTEQIRFLTAGVPASERVWELTTYDGNNTPVFITRLVHNKVFYLADQYVVNLFRLLDPVFLFTLSERVGLYDFSKARFMLSPIELPMFVFAGIVLLRQKHQYKKYIRILGLSFSVVVLMLGIFLSPPHPLLILPLVIIMRLMIILGIGVFFKRKK